MAFQKIYILLGFLSAWRCHAPLSKIRWSGDATRVGDAYR